MPDTTEREIKTAMGTYVDEHGVSRFAFKGDKVRVKSTYLERFDELNVENGDGKPADHERADVSVVNPEPTQSRRTRKDSTD